MKHLFNKIIAALLIKFIDNAHTSIVQLLLKMDGVYGVNLSIKNNTLFVTIILLEGDGYPKFYATLPISPSLFFIQMYQPNIAALLYGDAITLRRVQLANFLRK